MMLQKYLVEFIGTFVFLSVILRTGEAISIAIALACMIFFGGKVSGGHYNPAVSFMMMLNGKLSQGDLIPYVAAQLAGGAAALSFTKMK